jgi:hypothetical protein
MPKRHEWIFRVQPQVGGLSEVLVVILAATSRSIRGLFDFRCLMPLYLRKICANREVAGLKGTLSQIFYCPSE